MDDSYKASKAWHIGHELAAEVRHLVGQLPGNDEFNLAPQLHRLAQATPAKIAESVNCQLAHDKLAAYQLARTAVTELQEHLSLARDLHYIDDQLHHQLVTKAIAIYRLLSTLIQSTKRQTTTP